MSEVDQKEIADLRWRLGMPDANRSDIYDAVATKMVHFESQSRKNIISLVREELKNEPDLRKKAQLMGLERQLKNVDAKLDAVKR